jgi:hypothetical protein
MAATVSAVADGLKTKLATITGVRAFSYQPEQLNPPTAYPVLTQINYHKAFGGGNVQMEWSINLIVGRYTDSRAHAALDGYLSYDGASSLRAALETDPTLGGVCSNLVVTSGYNISSLSEAGADYLTIQVIVTVHG